MTSRILLIEDEPVIRMTVGDALRANGYHVTEAVDGESGEKVALREAVDLVLLDVMLPGKSGFEILHDLRADPAFEALPILMLTARGQARDREMAEKAGVSRFMTKPFSNSEMLDAVRELTS